MVVEATIHNTLGVLYDSIVITSILYGAGGIQVWYYYQKHRKNDYLAIQLLVGFVWICDTVQQGLLCAAVYKYSVTNHGNPGAMNEMQSEILTQLYLGGIMAFAVQQFYCWRIYGLSRNWIVAGSVSVLSLASLALIYVYTSITLAYSSLAELVQQATLCTILNAFNAATDIAITVAMVFYLQQSKTQFKRTKDLLNRLIVFTFNAGIPTSICAIADLATLNTMPQTFIYMSFYLIMDRLYTNSLLVTLNSRTFIRKAIDSGADVNTFNDSFTLSQFRIRSGNTQVDPEQAISIHIDKQTDVYSESTSRSNKSATHSDEPKHPGNTQ